MKLLDLTAYACPIPLVKLKFALKTGEPLPITVLLSDRGSRQDVPKFLKNKGYLVQSTQLSAKVLQLVIARAEQNVTV